MPVRHILVVEDSDEDFETVLDAARGAAVQRPIVRALSGGQALRLLGGPARGRETLPALLLLDLNTAGDDGREALRDIRQDPSLRTLPLVVLSASANPRDLDHCYSLGANAYHVKPVDHAAHLLVLRQIFAYWLGSVLLPT